MAAVDSFSLLYREMARSCSSSMETLALVGGLYTAYRAVRVLQSCWFGVRTHLLPRLMPPRQSLARRFGEWAVIHGASDDTAHAYAEELARQGMNIIFVSHESTMDASQALTQHYGVEATWVEVDLVGGKALQLLTEALRDKDVGILVNCSSRAPAPPGRLTETPETGLLGLVNRTVVGAALISRLVLPMMQQKRRGALVQLCSGAGAPPAGGAELLAAEGFLERFAQALQLEYAHQGIFFQTLTPLQVSPRGRGCSGLDLRGWLVPRAEVYARHAVSTLGVAHHTTGYWPHTLQRGIMSYVPSCIWSLASQFS